MATTIHIQVNNGQRLVIKASPTTTFRQIVNSVCDQQQLLNPEDYVLIMHGHTLLDLSLPICSTASAPGEILQLKHAEYIGVALQLKDGQTVMTQPFEINSTLWDILLGFERSSKSSNSPLNLTRSTGMPLQTPRKEFTSSQVYLMPVVKVLDQEYSSIQSLKSTSLKRAGLESGNTTLQVTMQPTNCNIEGFMDEIESEHPLHSTSNGRVNSQRSPSQSSFHLQQQAPLMSSRGGSINLVSRDGPSNAGGPSNDGGAGGSDGDAPRQTPTQDISSAMVEASQEIRQLREQQTQEAMTDRVKRLSKTSDSSADKDRFVRSMDFCEPMSRDSTSMGMSMSTGMGSSAVEMDIDSERNVPVPVRASSGSPSPHDDIVRQIAHRVSQKLREAQESGNSTANYHTLLAQEIAKGQLAGVLPSSPAGSRQNSVYISDPEDPAKSTKH